MSQTLENKYIGKYRLIKKCGHGFYGVIWMAETPERQRVAIKLLENDDRSSVELNGLREAMTLPPNDYLISIFDVGQFEDYYFYTMELADNFSEKSGEYIPASLDRFLNNDSSKSPMDTVELGLKLLNGLKHLHDSGLIHRDIKPENIIFVNGIPKISDVGLMQKISSHTSLYGTLGFITPERLMGRERGEYTVVDDLYAMGKLLYCYWTGNPAELFPSLPEDALKMTGASGLNHVLRIACNNHPERRFHSAQAFADALQH